MGDNNPQQNDQRLCTGSNSYRNINVPKMIAFVTSYIAIGLLNHLMSSVNSWVNIAQNGELLNSLSPKIKTGGSL